MPTFHLVDMACHRRREETAQVRRFLRANAWQEVLAPEGADRVLLFTCGEMRYKVARMVQAVEGLEGRLRPGAELLVGGCLPRTDPEALARVFRGRTFSPTDFSALDTLPGLRVPIRDLPPLYGPAAASRPLYRRGPWTTDLALPGGLACRLAGVARRAHLVPRSSHARFSRTTRMSLHVSAGCTQHCSYCAIRRATGEVRSLPVEGVLRTLSEGLALGFRTFDLLSDSIGGYGVDLGTDLGALLQAILALPGTFTLGISDLHPQGFSRFFEPIRDLARAGRLHYLYVPVQSGSPRILSLMKRPGDPADLAGKFRAIRLHREVFLQTGIIVGFPGETEEEFEATLAFLESVDFDSCYVHYYCDMPHSLASRLSQKTPPETMVERLKKLDRSGIKYNKTKTQIEWDSTLRLSCL